MTTFARWNEPLNGISITDDPASQPDFTWSEMQEVFPPKTDAQVYADPSLSTNADRTVFTRTWTVEDPPPPPPPPAVSIDVATLQALSDRVAVMTSLSDVQAYVAGWVAAYSAV